MNAQFAACIICPTKSVGFGARRISSEPRRWDPTRYGPPIPHGDVEASPPNRGGTKRHLARAASTFTVAIGAYLLIQKGFGSKNQETKGPGTMLETTQELIKTVETRTGRLVLVDVQPLSGTLLSSSHIARGSDPAHLIRITPRAQPDSDYLVTWECLHILRVFDPSTNTRFQLSGTPHGRTQAAELAAKHLKKAGLPIQHDAIIGFSKQMYDGLGLQLRSIPVGLRVDSELLELYPALASQQRNAALRQLEDSVKVLAPEVARLTPPKIRRASLNMNAAYALFWARVWNDLTVAIPYRASGFVADGERLLSIFDQLPSEAAHDRELINAWIKYLQLTSWYNLPDLP